jgi:hypothetical protein
VRGQADQRLRLLRQRPERQPARQHEQPAVARNRNRLGIRPAFWVLASSSL